MNQSFFVPGPLPGQNKYLGKGAHWTYNQDKKNWMQVISFYIREARLTPMQRVFIRWVWHEPTMRRDPDNLCGIGKKFILDALVKCGVLQDDGWGEIAGWSDEWIVSEDRHGVDVNLEECS